MYTQEITVQNEVGLHARPATYFIQKANEFKSGIWVEKEERHLGRGGEPPDQRQESAGRTVLGYCEGNQHCPHR